MNAMSAWLGNSPVLFEGKSRKNNFSKQEEQLERQLLNAGINANMLSKDWGVRLWTLRVKDDEVRIKIDVQKKANPSFKQLEKMFEKALGLPVSVKLKSVDCCGSGCNGCMAWKGNPERRKNWLG
jgi:hypothetical protein